MTKKQAVIFNYLFMNTLMCICMTLASLLVNVGFLTLPMYFSALLQALVVNNICTFVFRIPKLGELISLAIMKSPERRGFGPVTGCVFATLNTLFMTTFMTLLNVGPNAAYFPAWGLGFVAMEPVSVLVSLVAAEPLKKLAMKIK